MKSENPLKNAEVTQGSMLLQVSDQALQRPPAHAKARTKSVIKVVKPFVQPEILCVTSFPPRECGIATYSQDLIEAIQRTFDPTFSVRVCALESNEAHHAYPEIVDYILNTDLPQDYDRLSDDINGNDAIKMLVVQHEFGLFDSSGELFIHFLDSVGKDVAVVFHTVLPNPNPHMAMQVRRIARVADAIVVMTQTSHDILQVDYGIIPEKIHLIPHGTHLLPLLDKDGLKRKYDLTGRDVLATFGLISSGKGIELSLEALPEIVRVHPSVMFLIIGKTHPTVLKHEGERYREMLKSKVDELGLSGHVRFVDYFLPLPELLEYLQLTDIYLFTSKDPFQAVSGTFAYAISSGCPIISTPIPHAQEVLGNGVGMLIEFGNGPQLTEAVNGLLSDEGARNNMTSHGLHRMASTAWENAAIAHLGLFNQLAGGDFELRYKIPALKLDHLLNMTTETGMIQFSKLNQPDLDSGYTLDDNARALIAQTQLFSQFGDPAAFKAMEKFVGFIEHCQQPDGRFLNYVDQDGNFTPQNEETNLDDANGRAVWALGFLASQGDLIPKKLLRQANAILNRAIPEVTNLHSTRAMAFVIKGISGRYAVTPIQADRELIETLANRLLQMYRHVADENWCWYENYLTYANSLLPEAMLHAFIATGDAQYAEVAKRSFDFLLRKTMKNNMITVVSNKKWMQRDHDAASSTTDCEPGGEQPIDVAYTVLALRAFHKEFPHDGYLDKMTTAFEWFLGNNHLHRIIYNPATGGCYDGLELDHVNLNQGAESTVSYLMARLSMSIQEGNPAPSE